MLEKLASEVQFKATRSGGKGGQNVNKVSTKVELRFNIEQSMLFNEEEKRLLVKNLSHRLLEGEVIQVISEEERSQLLNRERALQKLWQVLQKGLYKPKPRKATKPRRSAIESRLKLKKMQAEKKINRRRDL